MTLTNTEIKSIFVKNHKDHDALQNTNFQHEYQYVYKGLIGFI